LPDIKWQPSAVENNIRTVDGNLESATAVWDVVVMDLESELQIVAVLDGQNLLASEIILVRGVDDGEFAGLERRVLQIHADEEEVRELDDMHRADATLSQEVVPVLLGVLVVDAILEVIRQEILDLDRRG